MIASLYRYSNILWQSGQAATKLMQLNTAF
jgi:hypothetical protein